MRKAKGSGFKMRSGNKTSFKMMGSSSPLKDSSLGINWSDPSTWGNLNLGTTWVPQLTAAEKAARTAEQKAARQAEIDAFNAGGGLDSAQNFNSETGQWDFSNMAPDDMTRAGKMWGGSVSAMPTSLPIGRLREINAAELSDDLETELLEEVEAPDYDADEGSGSLYDYSVRKGKSAIQKRAPKKKSGFKMKKRK